MEYRVRWVIEVDADSPHDAAVKARAAQIRPGTIATVFEVQEYRQVRAEWAAPIVTIDLSECDECGCGLVPGGELIGPWHAESCSLHPSAVAG
jgi:hypothetical protein